MWITAFSRSRLADGSGTEGGVRSPLGVLTSTGDAFPRSRIREPRRQRRTMSHLEPHDSPRVFISYSHDSDEHKDRVLAFSDRLIADGVDSHLDRYEPAPPEGWPEWMARQVEEANFVLVVCTQTYLRRMRGREERGRGLGATWEGQIITTELYEAQGHNSKFIPVVFSKTDVIHIPVFLRTTSWYDLSTTEGYDALYARVTGQHPVPKPPLGQRRYIELAPRGLQQRDSAPAPLLSEPTMAEEALVLLSHTNGQAYFIPAERIEEGASTTLTLVPSNARDAAFLAELRPHNLPLRIARPVQFAFGNTAFIAQVDSVTRTLEGGVDRWVVRLIPESRDNLAGMMEMSTGGLSPEQIAELRARRILLNESLTDFNGNFNGQLLNHLVEGVQLPLPVKQSPFPLLFQAIGANIPLFLAASRLLGILLLRLSGTVEHIFSLDLEMAGEDTLRVRFEGQRARRYQNVPPHRIRVEGTCALQ